MKRFVAFLMSVSAIAMAVSCKEGSGIKENPELQKDLVFSMSMSQSVYPVLAKGGEAIVFSYNLTKEGVGPYTFEQMTLSLEGTADPSAIESASLYLDPTGSSMVASAKPEGSRIVFNLSRPVSTPRLSGSVGLTLKDNGSGAEKKIVLSCESIKTSRGQWDGNGLAKLEPMRTGVALRKGGDDNVHTSRIPGLVTTKKGTLIALYDARNKAGSDLQGDIDIAINRSFDGGITWQPIQRIIDMGEWGGLPQKYNGVSDGCILCDEVTGDLIAAGLWMYGVLDANGKWIEGLTESSTAWNHQWQTGSKAGYDVKQTCQFLITRSSDDGLTWSEPENITRQVKKESHWLMAPAPGRGITMEDGTLVMPAEGRTETGERYSTIIYSVDRGHTWIAGEPASKNTNECQVVELSDHSLMLNMRLRSNGTNAGTGRYIATTTDLGKTWTEHPTSRKALIEPACQGSLLRHDYMENGEKKHVLLFMNPNSKTARKNLTIKVSFDDGMTWPESHWTLLDEGSGAGYSCLTSIDEQTIGAFYEGSRANIQFQAIPLKDLIKK